MIGWFTYLLPSEHGLMIYWHIGKSKNAKATVAITVEIKETNKLLKQKHWYVLGFFLIWKEFWLTCCANSKQHLHWIKEEEHDKKGDRGSEGQAQGLHGVQGLYSYKISCTWNKHHNNNTSGE